MFPWCLGLYIYDLIQEKAEYSTIDFSIVDIIQHRQEPGSKTA